MTDIVERLRKGTGESLEGLADEAADEIEALRKLVVDLSDDRDRWEEDAKQGGNAAYLREQLTAEREMSKMLYEALLVTNERGYALISVQEAIAKYEESRK